LMLRFIETHLLIASLKSSYLDLGCTDLRNGKISLAKTSCI